MLNLKQNPHNWTPTSIAAARQIEPAAENQGQAIISFLRGCGSEGAISEEIEAATGISGNSVRPRLIQLRRAGLVTDSGRVRMTKAKRMAVVWVAVEQA